MEVQFLSHLADDLLSGLRTKTTEFSTSAVANDAEVDCVTETWLNSNINDSELFDFNSYNIFQKDRDLHRVENWMGVEFLLQLRKRSMLPLFLHGPAMVFFKICG